MPSILPPWTDADPVLHARLGDAIDPDRKVLEGLERIVPLSGKRIADIGTGIGHYPMILARRTGRTYGIESDPDLLAAARERAGEAHQPNIRIVEGDLRQLPLRDGAVDVVLTSQIEPDDSYRPAIAEALRVLRPNGRLIVIGYYGRDDVAALLEPEVVAHALEATQRRTGWWLRNGFKIKVVHARLDLRDEVAGDHQLDRAALADDARQPLRATGAGEHAEVDLGESDLPGVLPCDPDVARAREREPGTGARPVHRRDHHPAMTERPKPMRDARGRSSRPGGRPAAPTRSRAVWSADGPTRAAPTSSPTASRRSSGCRSTCTSAARATCSIPRV